MPVPDHLESQKRVYAVWARIYDRIYQNLLAGPQREAVAAACACGPDILEIGVGTGLTLPYFTAGSRVVGADLSLDMLKVANRKVASQGLSHVRGLMVMDACRLGFADEAFDAVTAQFVITLVPDPEQALTEMDRVLKPGGEIVISSRLVDDGGPFAALWSA
ncbi:MAG: class I SAM-dependent methyltransferase, partial [Bosea sp. (in: a-proteobacteria)]|nr:class I SAM-dependent methyltransferase [Bosea sp. (in: a-proteobacteria)]